MRGLCSVMVAVSAAALIFVPNGTALAQGTPPGSETATAAPPSTSVAESPGPEKAKAAPKKKKPAKMTRQQEIDRSIERGTVPARYRSSVPKEYHQYIPFDRR